jgi:hypothetical protein
MTDDARDAFLGALVIWTRNDHTHGQDVVDAACEALVEGLDSPALRDLAGLYPDTPHEILRLTAENAVTELGITLPVGKEALDRFAVRLQARAMLDGTTAQRAFAEWTLSIDTENHPEALSRIQGAAYEYDLLDDLAEHLGAGTPTHAEATASLDERVHLIAHDLLTEPT